MQRRQAWCYGSPGIAWALWESGRVLGRKDLEAFALDSMASFCAAFDPDFHLDAEPVARLGFCHGAAGTLAVFNNAKVPLGVACSLLFFGETADLPRLAVGGALLIAAVAVAETKSRPV